MHQNNTLTLNMIRLKCVQYYFAGELCPFIVALSQMYQITLEDNNIEKNKIKHKYMKLSK